MEEYKILPANKIAEIRMYLDLYHDRIISKKTMIEKAGLDYKEEMKQMNQEREEGEKIHQE